MNTEKDLQAYLLEDKELELATGGVQPYCRVTYKSESGVSGHITLGSQEKLDQLIKKYNERGWKYEITYL